MKHYALALFSLTLLSTSAVAVELTSEAQKLSYIYGVQFGQNIKSDNFNLDLDAFNAGFNDVIQDNPPQVSEDAARQVIQSYQQQKQIQIAEMGAKKQREADQFFAKNAKQAGVKTTESGLQYRVIKAGNGETPTISDTVVAHYTGKLLDGTVFDSSHDRGEPATFPLSGVIKGWQEALPMMKVGGQWQIVVPAALAYGDRGIGKLIGPNEALIFDIELISIEK